MILLINNPSHSGVAAVGLGYRRAFEFLGLDFKYLGFDNGVAPRPHNDYVNTVIQAELSTKTYSHVIFIQPTYINSSTYNVLLKAKHHGIKIYSIQTEDPYSVSGVLQIINLFDKSFTNEKVCASTYPQFMEYLPVAFDSFQMYPYNRDNAMDYDMAMICSFYGNREKLYRTICDSKLKIFAGGNIAYLVKNGISVDISKFNSAPGIMPRYQELMIYSRSKFVLNIHRDPKLVGRSDFNVPQAKCHPIFKDAYSPNPRFFDSICCGAYPINDGSRSECLALIENAALFSQKEYSALFYSAISASDSVDRFEKINSDYSIYEGIIKKIQKPFLKNHTYLSRAIELVGKIGIKVNG